MGMFSFAKGIGEKLFGKSVAETEAPVAPAPVAELSAQDVANRLLKRAMDLGLPVTGLSVGFNTTTDTATVTGEAATQADREKIVLALGNVDAVAHVEDNMTVATPEPESRMYTIKSGDTLSAVAKEMYGNANDYNKIFEANRPMLSSPDKIYPGQVLRIPA